MPYRKLSFRRPRRKILRRRRAPLRSRGSVPMRFKKYVKNQIHRNIENKKSLTYGANNAIVPGTATSMVKPLLNPCSQGMGEDVRTGNCIKIVRGKLDIFYNLLPYDSVYTAEGRPVWVKVWIIRDLRQSFQTTGLSDLGKFFAGNATSLGFQNTMQDMCLPVNTDYYRVLYSTCFKLGSASNLSGGWAGGSDNWSDNSPFSKHLIINWGKWIKKQLKFDDNVSPYYPQNANLYLVHQAVSATGESISDGQKCVEFHYCNQQIYEDA